MPVFQNDYRHMLDVLANRKPSRLPLYEHIVSVEIMEKILNVKFGDLLDGDLTDQQEFFRYYNRFFQEMTYDTVSFEATIVDCLPDHGAIYGGKPGPIQNRDDFAKYPWDEIPVRFWDIAAPRFEAIGKSLPPGMKALGGVGNGIFEISEDLVGFENLAYMQLDDPELYTALYQKIGDLMVELWRTFLDQYADDFEICRFGDDLGFKTSTLTSPKNIRNYIFPQYKRVIDLIKSKGKPFLWHSCGKIFSVMEDAIALGIDAKHSNEDAIAPFEEWITRYGDRIGLLGGIDVDLLCQNKPEDVFDIVFERGQKFRMMANGYALGSGNSIPDYVPVEGYLAMVSATKRIREIEQ
jgi:uroporphyrinogen decarboxylase